MPNDGSSPPKGTGAAPLNPGPGHRPRPRARGASGHRGWFRRFRSALVRWAPRGILWDRERRISPPSNGRKRESGCPGGCEVPVQENTKKPSENGEKPPFPGWIFVVLKFIKYELFLLFYSFSTLITGNFARRREPARLELPRIPQPASRLTPHPAPPSAPRTPLRALISARGRLAPPAAIFSCVFAPNLRVRRGQ